MRAAVAGADITARNEDTLATRVTQTDEQGRFSLTALAIGTYTLRVEKTGFAGVMVSRFLLSVGEVSVHDLQLRVSAVKEEMTVTEKPNAVDAATATSSVALGYDRIEEAPASNRNYLNFTLIAPGVKTSPGSTAQQSATAVRNPLGDSGFSFGGMRGRNNSITIDGLDNRDETTGGNRVAIGFEMVQEFRVSATAVGAESGGSAGGVVNMVTRSGTNVWHGDATLFAQNEAFNAKKPDVETSGKPTFHRYQPGTSTNGPLRKDQTFISAAVEYERESSQEWSGPKNADAIDRALQMPVYRALGPLTGLTRGLFDAGVRGTDASVKLNHQIDSQDALSVRYSFSRGRLLDDARASDNFGDVSAFGSTLTTDHSLAADWLRAPSGMWLNDLRVQFAQRDMGVTPNSQGPMFEIPGVATFGQSYLLNSNRTERHTQAVESVEYSRGAHRLNAGFDIQDVEFDGSVRNRFAGIYIFPTLADFEQARPDVFIRAFGDPHTSFRTVPIGLWLKDEWRPMRGLRIEIGARFEKQSMPARLPSSSNNVAPRVGLAWNPARSTVIRGAFGLFYDRYPLAFLNDAIQKDGRQAFEFYAFDVNAVNLLRGASAFAPETLYAVSHNFPSTYARKFALGLEQGFGPASSLTIEASQVRGLHLPRMRNIDSQLPPEFQLEQTARSTYRGMSVSFNRRLSKELAILAAYDVSRTNDDSSDFDEQPMIPSNTRLDWGRSRQDQFQRLALSSLFELPAEELRFIREKYRDWLEGIAIAPILTAGSGRPLNALETTDVFRTGAYPITARPPGFARNSFRSPSTLSLDLRVMKTVDIWEHRAKLQFGAESFNLTNHANVLRVSPYFVTSTYGGVVEALPGRQVQLVFHLEY